MDGIRVVPETRGPKLYLQDVKDKDDFWEMRWSGSGASQVCALDRC